VTTAKKSQAQTCEAWFWTKVLQPCPRPRSRCLGRYFATVRGETRQPSFRRPENLRNGGDDCTGDRSGDPLAKGRVREDASEERERSVGHVRKPPGDWFLQDSYSVSGLGIASAAAICPLAVSGEASPPYSVGTLRYFMGALASSNVLASTASAGTADFAFGMVNRT
jgi:hypothetical protein